MGTSSTLGRADRDRARRCVLTPYEVVTCGAAACGGRGRVPRLRHDRAGRARRDRGRAAVGLVVAAGPGRVASRCRRCSAGTSTRAATCSGCRPPTASGARRSRRPACSPSSSPWPACGGARRGPDAVVAPPAAGVVRRGAGVAARARAGRRRAGADAGDGQRRRVPRHRPAGHRRPRDAGRVRRPDPGLAPGQLADPPRRPPARGACCSTSRWCGSGSAATSPAALVVVAVAATIPVAALATLRVLGAERLARLAAPFLVLTPAAVFLAVSADAVFAACAAWGLAALAASATAAGRGAGSWAGASSPGCCSAGA